MSYILDALRRADAERERGHVPGLHTRGTATDATAGRSSPALRAGLLGLGGGAALALIALLMWRHGAEERSVVVATAPVQVQAPAPVVPPAVPVAPALPLPPPKVEPLPAPAVRIEPPSSTAPAVRKRTAPAVVAATAVVAPPAAASAPRVYKLEELPDDIRRQLPALAVGGSAYSASPASRFVMVNGQLFHEGDALAPGLVLEQIRFKSAVLAFKGYRYGIGF